MVQAVQVAHPTPGDARYLALTTFRRDGRAVVTPVWCVAMGGRIFVGTTAGTGKVKRIRNNPRVRFAPCNASGSRMFADWREGRAHAVEDEATLEAFAAALKRKYTWQYYLVQLIYRLRGVWDERMVLAIVEPPPEGAIHETKSA